MQSINVNDGKEYIMVEKDYMLYGTKILNLKTQEALWHKDFEFKNSRNRFINLFMGKQIC